jgi:hypothetical protein
LRRIHGRVGKIAAMIRGLVVQPRASVTKRPLPLAKKKRFARENIVKNDGMERMNCNSPACEHQALQRMSKERCAKKMMRRNKERVLYFVA